VSGPAAGTYEIRLDGWVKQEEIRSPEEARDAIEQWLCAVEDHPFDDVKNSNPRNRLKGVDNRRAVLWALGEWAYEHGTIHPAPGMAELSQRSGINPGRVSKHLRAEAKLKRFVRLVRRGEKGNPRTAQRRATEYKMMVDNPTVRANSSHITRANVRAKLRANTTHRLHNGVQQVPLKNRVRVPVAPVGDENVINPSAAAAAPRPSTTPSSPPERFTPCSVQERTVRA
jgi:hypothetical protein